MPKWSWPGVLIYSIERKNLGKNLKTILFRSIEKKNQKRELG